MAREEERGGEFGLWSLCFFLSSTNNPLPLPQKLPRMSLLIDRDEREYFWRKKKREKESSFVRGRGEMVAVNYLIGSCELVLFTI